MKYSICSYSFHRSSDMDIFDNITWNKEHGFDLLDPWMKHMADGYVDTEAGHEFLTKVKAAAEEVGLPFGCVAVDGAHIYEPTAE
ncbi:MAG: hypothetical protein AAF639_21430, partial [Chloroflexota bacterium]